MSANQDFHGRDSPPERAEPRRVNREDTFDAIVRQIRLRIERSAQELARRIGAFILQNFRNLTIGLWEGVRIAFFLYAMFLFPYFAWASLGEALIRRETTLGVAIGAALIFGPIVGAFLLMRQWRIPPEQIAPPSVPLRLVPDIAAPTEGTESIPPPVSSEGLFEGAWKALGVLFGAIDPQRLESGLLFYLVVVLGGALLISVTMLLTPLGSALSETLMAQPNLLLMAMVAASLRMLQQGFTLGLDLLGLLFDS